MWISSWMAGRTTLGCSVNISDSVRIVRALSFRLSENKDIIKLT